MDTLTEIELCKPLPFIFGANGAFGITDGTAHGTVIVTREAMEASAILPDASLTRLSRYTLRVDVKATGSTLVHPRTISDHALIFAPSCDRLNSPLYLVWTAKEAILRGLWVGSSPSRLAAHSRNRFCP